MAKESSFDVVSTVDMQEVDNAFQQAKKELAQRYDLKDSRRRDRARQGEAGPHRVGALRFRGQTGHRRHRQQAGEARHRSGRREVGRSAAGRRTERAAEREHRRRHRQGHGRRINKDIKATKLKVKVQIEGDKLRVSSASRDTLQEVIAFLKGQDYGQPLQYVNYR